MLPQAPLSISPVPVKINGVTIPIPSKLSQTLACNLQSNISQESQTKIAALQRRFIEAINSSRGLTKNIKERLSGYAVGTTLGLTYKELVVPLDVSKRTLDYWTGYFATKLGTTKISKPLLGILAYICGFVKLDDVLTAAGIELPKVEPDFTGV